MSDNNNARTVISVVVGSAVALLALMLGPLLVGEYISQLGVSESHAGMILSVELAAFTLGAVVLFVILDKNWRHIVSISLLFMVTGNLLLLFVDGLTAFILCRVVAGLGSGMLMTMTIQVIGLMPNTDRIYGLWTVGQLTLGAVGMVLFPTITAYGGIKSIFMIWALLAALLVVTIKSYPVGRDTDTKQGNPQATGHIFTLGLLCLTGLFIYYSGQAGVWVYLERMGASWNIPQDVVANTLFASLIAGIAGSGLAIFLGDRIGRTIPISASMFCSALSIIMLTQSGGVTLFIIAACIFNFGWYLFLPYISAVVAVADNNGKLLTGLAFIFPASLAAGPAVAAVLIGNSGSLLPCLIFGLVSIPVGLLLLLPATRLK